MGIHLVGNLTAMNYMSDNTGLSI